MSTNKSLQYQNGFTLIELAIVLVIIAVLIGSFISTLAIRIETTQIEKTKDELEEIKQALIGYAFTNGYLPCPDCLAIIGCNAAGFRDGVEDRGGVAAADSCSTGNDVGSVPWVTLGLGQGDSWNTHYRYWVDNTYAIDNTVTPNSSFTLSSANGAGLIQEPDYVVDPTGGTLDDMADNIVAVIYSHGKNAYGGLSVEGVILPGIPVANVDEIENTDPNTTFVSRPPTTEEAATAGGEFDDILIWLTEFELKAKMVEAGRLP